VLEFAQLDMLSATTGWAASSAGLFKTTDGEHWAEQPTGLDHEPAVVHFVSPREGWLVAAPWGAGEFIGLPDAVVAHTTDGGATWTPLDKVPSDVQSVCFTGPDDGWLATRDSVYRSTDDGSTWTLSLDHAVTPLDGQGVVSLECASPDAAWIQFAPGGAAAGSSPYVLFSTADGGTSWTPVLACGCIAEQLHAPAGPGSYPGPFSVIDPKTVFVLGYSPAAVTLQAVFITNGTDIGPQLTVTQNLLDGAGFTPVAVSFIDARHGVVVGDADSRRPSVYTTSDAGVTWTPASIDGRASAGASKPCTSEALAVRSAEPLSPPTGRSPLALGFVNGGPASCSVDGYPDLTLLDADDNVLPFEQHHGGGMVVGAATPSRIDVPPGGTVYVVIDKYRCDLAAIADVETIHLGLPDDGGMITVPSDDHRYAFCGAGDPGSTIDVSPFGLSIADLLAR
jgi:hypothetical protein